MNPSPFFKGVIVTLVALALLAMALLQNAVYAADVPARAVAPVVQPEGSDGVMVQIGWYEYERQPNVIVLYCVPEGDVTLTCVIYVTTPKGNAVVLVDGIAATTVAS